MSNGLKDSKARMMSSFLGNHVSPSPDESRSPSEDAGSPGLPGDVGNYTATGNSLSALLCISHV